MIPGTADNPWGPNLDPAFVLVYGNPDVGKSHDLIAAAGSRGCYFTFEGGLAPAATLGISLKPGSPADGGQVVKTARYLWDITNWINWMGEQPWMQLPVAERPFLYLVIDDLSVFMKQTWNAICDKLPVGRGTGGNQFLRYDELNAYAGQFRFAARSCGMHVLAGSHYKKRSTDKDGTPKPGTKGGPWMPSATSMEELVQLTDATLWAIPEPAQKPWGVIYKGSTNVKDPTHWTKDRFRKCWGKGPMNVREFLRAAGYWMPREPGREWQDEWAENIAQQISGGEDRATVYLDTYARLLKDGVYDAWAEQACRDGVNRYDFRRIASERVANQFATAKPRAGGAPPPPTGTTTAPPPPTNPATK